MRVTSFKSPVPKRATGTPALQREKHVKRPALSVQLRLQKRIGALLREARIEAGLTQTDVADLADMAQSHISEVERGLPNITLETLCLLAGAVGLEPEVNLHNKPTRGRRPRTSHS
jgi:HTH-type transcriptional regulator/antitoxin HipB